MEWYSAHTVIGIRRIDGVGPISVTENIYLIGAVSSEEALDKAKIISDNEGFEDKSITIDDFSAEVCFKGVRKICTICNNAHHQYKSPPLDGSEISYIEYEVNNIETLDKVLNGNSVFLKFIE